MDNKEYVVYVTPTRIVGPLTKEEAEVLMLKMKDFVPFIKRMIPPDEFNKYLESLESLEVL